MNKYLLKIKEMKPLVFLLSIPILNIAYILLNNAGRGSQSLALTVDGAIPFLKWFIVPYILWYPFIFALFIYLCYKDRQMYYRTLVSYNISLVICYIIYFFYQTHVERPALSGDDLMTQLVTLIYAADEPYNAFPSIHVLSTYLMMRAFRYVSRNTFARTAVDAMGLAIILSTVFVKQHVVLDAVAAIVIGEVIFIFICKAPFQFNRGRVLSWQKKRYSWSTTKRKY